MEAQRVALAAGQNGTISPFVVYVEDDQAVATRFCWLTMLDSQVGIGSSACLIKQAKALLQRVGLVT
jgi:hypothetical protein